MSNDWKEQLKNSINTVEKLEEVVSLTAEEKKQIKEVCNDFNFSITPYYASLMDPNDRKCTIRMQAIPSIDETYNIYGTAEQMGLKNVYELDGNIHNNWCSKCGKTFSMEYLRDSRDVPLCDVCKGAIRPGIRLHGERMRNNVLTLAANACAEAEGYAVYRFDETQNQWTNIANIEETAYVDSGLLAGTEYTYKVGAYLSDGDTLYEGDQSEEVIICTLKDEENGSGSDDGNGSGSDE